MTGRTGSIGPIKGGIIAGTPNVASPDSSHLDCPMRFHRCKCEENDLRLRRGSTLLWIILGLLIGLLLVNVAHAQVGPAQSGLVGNPTFGTGAPTGSCISGSIYTNNNNGNVYSCNSGTWTLVTGGGGSGCVPPGTANNLLYDATGGACNDLGSLGTTSTLLHGNAAGLPTFGSVVSADLNITPTTCTNQFLTAISAAAGGTCGTVTLASAQFANQGTTTTVLHGNGAGNPAFGAVVSADLNITATTCTNQFLNAISSAAGGTCASVASAALNITTTSCTNQAVTAISSGAVGTCTTLTKSFLPAATVYTDQSNTYSAGTQDFTAATNALVTTQSASDNSTKAASTAYVTTAVANAIAAVNPAMAVSAATTAAADTSGFTYSNGVGGIGATFTGSVNTAVTIDGFTFNALGQRLLVKNDTQAPSGAFNGIYSVTQLQTGILAPILTRALDYDQPSDINSTGAIPVINGTANADTSWLLTSTVATIGTNALTYVQFSIAPTSIVTQASNGAANQVCTYTGANKICVPGSVTNAMLSSAATTVNGQTCTLGSTCAVESATSGQVAISGGSGGALTGSADLTYSTHTFSGISTTIFDLSPATGTAAFKVPSTTTNTATAAGVFDYDTTNSNYHANSGADSLVGIVPTASVPATGDIIDASVASSKFLLHDSGVATGNVVTAASAATAASQTCVSSGASKTCSYIEFPDVRVIPAANCNNTTAGAGWSLPSGGTVACRAGTNNLGGSIVITDTSSTFPQFGIAIPEDDDVTIAADIPYIRFQISSSNAVNNATIIPQVKVACEKGDGSTTDDVAFNAAHSLSTITENTTAQQFWSTSNVQMNSTDMTGCVKGSWMIVQVGRATDTDVATVRFYSATLTFPRRLVVQAD